MFRIAVRNVLIRLGVALPILLISGPLVGWMLASSDVGRSPGPSLTAFYASFVFWYPIWALPALAIAAIHQLVLAALPRAWSVRTTRLVILGTSFAIGALIASYVASESTRARGVALAVALLPAAAVYGVLAKPLRPREPEQHSNDMA